MGLGLLLNRNTYRFIEDTTVPVGDDTTQIDLLLVSPYGVFVIEIKNMTGWIFGQPNKSHWTQVKYRFKNKFQNPIHQNSMHVKVVQDLLRLKTNQIHNVVVFVGACRFKTPMPTEVVHGVLSLAHFIRTKRDLVLTDDEVRRCTEDILKRRLTPGFRTARTHVRNVKKRIANYATDSGSACPRCGGTMVERVNRRTGERFLGCKRFPQCRGTRQGQIP